MVQLRTEKYLYKLYEDVTLLRVIPKPLLSFAHKAKKGSQKAAGYLQFPLIEHLLGYYKTQRNLRAYAGRKHRRLEIGPGRERLPGFETVNIVNGPQVDYVCDAARPLPFPDSTFELIYASHVLEHIPWYQTEAVLGEWVRVLAPGGQLEVWVPDGLKICQVIVDHSLSVENSSYLDGWTVRNPRQDPFMWASGRLFYGARDDYPSWHKAVFTAKSLKDLFWVVGLVNVTELIPSDVRGYNHGWINLGIKGTKP